MPYSPNVERIQQLLRDRHGQQCDVDGLYGPGTERAILNVLEADTRKDEQAIADAENEGMPAAPAASVGKLVLTAIPHITQWDYPHVEILPQRHVEEMGEDGNPKLDDEGRAITKTLPAETCQDYGCMSCCIELLRARDDGDTPNIEWFIPALKEIGGYDTNGKVIWSKVKQLTGFEHTPHSGDDRIEKARAEINAGRPVILEITTSKGTGHFILGIGYDPVGFHCHDVGSWRGNAYENPNRTERPGQTFVKYEDVRRVDAMVKGA